MNMRIKDKTMKPNEIKTRLILAGIFVVILWAIFWMIPTDTIQHTNKDQ